MGVRPIGRSNRLCSCFPLTCTWSRSISVGSARDKPADGYRLEDVATDVVGMLDLLDLPVALVVGSSSGGYVVQQLAVGRRRC